MARGQDIIITARTLTGSILTESQGWTDMGITPMATIRSLGRHGILLTTRNRTSPILRRSANARLHLLHPRRRIITTRRSLLIADPLAHRRRRRRLLLLLQGGQSTSSLTSSLTTFRQILHILIIIEARGTTSSRMKATGRIMRAHHLLSKKAVPRDLLTLRNLMDLLMDLWTLPRSHLMVLPMVRITESLPKMDRTSHLLRHHRITMKDLLIRAIDDLILLRPTFDASLTP